MRLGHGFEWVRACAMTCKIDPCFSRLCSWLLKMCATCNFNKMLFSSYHCVMDFKYFAYLYRK
jgi:hypothetical protein